eukprot:9954911-Heterocapsa_arctica.AAC.1
MLGILNRPELAPPARGPPRAAGVSLAALATTSSSTAWSSPLALGSAAGVAPSRFARCDPCAASQVGA